MAGLERVHGDEAEARDLAEASRETSWAGRGFLRELFLGNLHIDWIHPFPEVRTDRAEFREFMLELERFLHSEVNPFEIDAKGEYPQRVLDRLRAMGAFGMKIDRQYGGLGFSQQEYCHALERIAQVDANLVALLSAHQSIGVPQPLRRFGTEAQKREYLPRCARGAISAFALTETQVGSDPARLATTARRTPQGDYVLDGEKLWTTNGTLAELLIVMARDPETKRISCFVVETAWPGVEVVHRCRFMGLRALANAVIRLNHVCVPAKNRIGAEGEGLKIALVTLNTGRLSLPAAAVGIARRCSEIARAWASERVQWGAPIGKHEAIAHKLADMVTDTFAMESVSYLANELAERSGYDIRLEAAAAKEWNSTRGWRIVDDTMQIRGGRGYETAQSLAARGEAPIPVETMMRDFRINLIFEGSSEIMHLFIARESVDKHLEIAGVLVDPKASLRMKLAKLPGIVWFYARWYLSRWFGWHAWPRFRELGPLAGHVRWVARASRRLARAVFHGMVVHRAKLEKKQAFLFRLVDIGLGLFAMAATCSRALQLARTRGNEPSAGGVLALADGFCSRARRSIEETFRELWDNDDEARYRLAQRMLAGDHRWLERTPRAGRQEGRPRLDPHPGVPLTET